MSCNGYPEGDTLSIVAMVLVNLALHHMHQNACPLASIMTFVDNWEGVAQEVDHTCRAYTAMEKFAEIVHLPLDTKKTHFWANNSDDRRVLRARQKKVVLHAQDLDGHLNFSRRFTNYSSRARIAKNAAFWGMLYRSSAPLDQKLRAVATVA